MNDNSFLTKMHFKFVEKYRDLNNWKNLETMEISEIKEHISPLAKPTKDNELARRFDHLMYSIQLGLIQSKNINKPIKIVTDTAERLSNRYTIPQVLDQRTVIEKVQTQEFWNSVNVFELDNVRTAIRDLLQYLDKVVRKVYYVNYVDEFISETGGKVIFNVNETAFREDKN